MECHSRARWRDVPLPPLSQGRNVLLLSDRLARCSARGAPSRSTCAFGNGLGNPSANQGAHFIGRFALLRRSVGFLDRERQFPLQRGVIAEPLRNEPRFRSLSLLFRERLNCSLDFSDRAHRLQDLMRCVGRFQPNATADSVSLPRRTVGEGR